MLGAVVRLTETDFQLVECFQDGHSLCALMPACHLKKVLADALEAFFVQLDGVTLADLMNTTQAQRTVLQPIEFTPSRARSRPRPAP